MLIAALASQALGAELVNMEFKQAPLGEVLQILGQLGGITSWWIRRCGVK